MAKKTAKKSEEMMMSMSCCTSSYGMVHMLGGVGVGLLVASYFDLPMIMFWGWVLVGVAVVGHLTGKAKCC